MTESATCRGNFEDQRRILRVEAQRDRYRDRAENLEIEAQRQSRRVAKQAAELGELRAVLEEHAGRLAFLEPLVERQRAKIKAQRDALTKKERAILRLRSALGWDVKPRGRPCWNCGNDRATCTCPNGTASADGR